MIVRVIFHGESGRRISAFQQFDVLSHRQRYTSRGFSGPKKVRFNNVEFHTGRVSLIRCVSIPSLETASYGLFSHGGVVARRHTRFPRLAQASSNKLEERTRREENSSTYTTRDRPTPRIQGKTGSRHGQSPCTTWRRKETKANFWKKTKSNGILQIHQSHFPPDSRGETSSKKIP